jgi:hypothetical protein
MYSTVDTIPGHSTAFRPRLPSRICDEYWKGSFCSVIMSKRKEVSHRKAQYHLVTTWTNVSNSIFDIEEWNPLDSDSRVGWFLFIPIEKG